MTSTAHVHSLSVAASLSVLLLASACTIKSKTTEPDGGVSASGGAAGAQGGGQSGGATVRGGTGSGGRPSADASTPDGAPNGHDAGPDGGTAGDAGGAVSPERILASPYVKAALAAASAAGHPVLTHTERSAPKITGYYSKPEHEGKVVLTDNGVGVNNGITGTELRITVDSSDLVTDASVSFDSGYITGGSVETGMVLRGANDEFTLYTTYRAACPEAGSDFAVDGYSITSAQFVDATGNWINVRRLIVTLSTSGTLTPGCADVFLGGTEHPGGFGLSEVPRYVSVTPADLVYMCVDQNAGYVELETWTHADGGTCTCEPDYAVYCR